MPAGTSNRDLSGDEIPGALSDLELDEQPRNSFSLFLGLCTISFPDERRDKKGKPGKNTYPAGKADKLHLPVIGKR